VIGYGESGNLLGHRKGPTSDGDEALAHYNVPYASAGPSEVDHQALSEDIEWHREPIKPLESAGPLDRKTNDDAPHAGDDVVRGADVPSLSDGGAVDNLEVGGEIAVPAVVGDLPGCGEKTGAEQCAVDEEMVRNERLGREIAFDEVGADEKDDAKNQHGDDVSGFPSIWRSVCKGEGKEEEREAGSQDEDAKDWAVVSFGE